MIEQVAVLTGIGRINPVVRAHDIGCTGSHGLSEWPQVQLMKRAVIEVSGYSSHNSSIGGGRSTPVIFLLIDNIVLL